MNAAPERLETERLVLVRPTLAHEEALIPMLRDPRVAATLNDDGLPPSVERVQAQLRAKIEHWDVHGFGLWVACDQATGTLVGRGGLQHTFLPGVDEIEAAWTIAADRWGKGLATEIARASVTVAFDVLELPRIIAYTMDSNHASRRVMEKSGFEFDRNVQRDGLPHVLYVQHRC